MNIIAHTTSHLHIHAEDAAAFALCVIVIVFFALLGRRS